MKRHVRYCLLLLLPWAAAAAELDVTTEAGTLTVTVTGLKRDTGQGRFALYTSAAAYDARQPTRTTARAVTNGVCLWIIDALPAGDYMISFFHDINDNQRLDTTGPGIPVEPMAFSNNARPRFGPPRYDRMVITFDGTAKALELEAFDALGRRGRIGVGLGLIFNQNPYETGSPRILVIPAITYIGTRFSLTGPSAQFRLLTTGAATLTAHARYSFDRFDNEGSERLAGLTRRSDTVMGGATLSYALTDDLAISLAAESDLLGEHGGQRAAARCSYTWRVADIGITPSLGAEWLGAATAAHRYGVAPSEANDSRPAHRPGAVLNGTAGLGLRYSLTDATALFGSATVTLFGSGIADSPIVVRDAVTSIFLALAYSL